MTLKSAVNCLYTMYLNGDHNMIMVGWMEIIEILIISQSSLMTLTRLILVGLLFDQLYQILIKFTSQQPVTSYNTSIIEPISTDSPPNDKWGFWLFNGLVCRMYRLYSTNLVCLASERFWYWYGWNPYL